MKEISITEKLILFFVFIGLISIVAVGAYSYHYAKNALINRTFDQLVSVRLEKKNRVEQFFLERMRDMRFLAESEEFAGIIDGHLLTGVSPDSCGIVRISKSINQIIHAEGYSNRLFAVTLKHEVFHLVPEAGSGEPDTIHQAREFREFCNNLATTGSPVIQDLTKSNPFILAGAPVFNRVGKLSGFVVLEIPVDALNSIMFDASKKNGLGNTGETYLVSDDFLMRSNSRFKGNAILNISVKSESVISGFKNLTGTGIVKDYRDISCLSSYGQVNVPGLNWVMIAEIDELEAMAPINALRNSILLISIIIAASVFILALLFSLRITAPLKKLQLASEQIGEGHYGINLPVVSQDELGKLTATFNQMADRIKKQSEEIEIEKTKRISSLLDGQEMERQRLARDLHDSLGQTILTANMKLEQARNADPEKIKQYIGETQEFLKQIIQEIRSISNNLVPGILAMFGIDQGLETLCRDSARNSGIRMIYTGENIPDSLPTNLQIYLFRISQEAINNIIKHSSATEASIRMRVDQTKVFLEISDNGAGFDPMVTAMGNGLMNIKERVKVFQGLCEISSAPGQGTLINIEIPTNCHEYD